MCVCVRIRSSLMIFDGIDNSHQAVLSICQMFPEYIEPPRMRYNLSSCSNFSQRWRRPHESHGQKNLQWIRKHNKKWRITDHTNCPLTSTSVTFIMQEMQRISANRRTDISQTAALSKQNTSQFESYPDRDIYVYKYIYIYVCLASNIKRKWDHTGSGSEEESNSNLNKQWQTNCISLCLHHTHFVTFWLFFNCFYEW